MIALDSASGFIQFPKIFDYQLLMDNIKRPINIFEPRKKSEWEPIIPWWPFFKRPKVLDKPIAADTFWY